MGHRPHDNGTGAHLSYRHSASSKEARIFLNLFGWLIVAAAAGLLGRLTWRAWHAHNGLLKWGGGVLGGLLTLVAVLATAVLGRGLYIMCSAPPHTDAPALKVAGTPGGLAPVGPSLRVVIGWTRAQFITTLRTGVDPRGHQLSSVMPSKTFGKLDDDELGGVYEYLHGLASLTASP